MAKSEVAVSLGFVKGGQGRVGRRMPRVHFQGGSILNTARANPTKNPEDLQRVVAALDQLGIGFLATIGGDDTMFAASQVAKQAGGRIRVCHVPKTIDNDLPLPGEI